MVSGRSKAKAIRARRQEKRRIATRVVYGQGRLDDAIPREALPADPLKLLHDNTYGPRPRFYLDSPFHCVDCGIREVWTAADQKWWYEEMQGKIGSRANRCRDCRRKRRLRRSQERRAHFEGLIEKYGIEATAQRLSLAVEVVERMRGRWDD